MGSHLVAISATPLGTQVRVFVDQKVLRRYFDFDFDFDCYDE